MIAKTTTLSPNLLLTIALAPLAGAWIAGLFGRQDRPRRRAQRDHPRRGGGLRAVGLVLRDVIVDGARSTRRSTSGMVIGGLKMEVGFLDRRPVGADDGRGDLRLADGARLHHRLHGRRPGYQRFFSYISLFTFSMLMLVMSNNFLQLFFGWEAVGLVATC